MKTAKQLNSCIAGKQENKTANYLDETDTQIDSQIAKQTDSYTKKELDSNTDNQLNSKTNRQLISITARHLGN